MAPKILKLRHYSIVLKFPLFSVTTSWVDSQLVLSILEGEKQRRVERGRKGTSIQRMTSMRVLVSHDGGLRGAAVEEDE